MSAAVTTLAKYLPESALDDSCQLLDERQLDKLALMAEEIRSITDAVTSKPLADDADEGRASELLNRGAAALKELDALRKARVGPLNEEVKAVNGLFKVVTDPCEALVGKGGKLERLILTYRSMKKARLQREQDEALRKQREAAEREAQAMALAASATDEQARAVALEAADEASADQAAAALAEPLPMPVGVRTDSGSVSARKVWTVEVVDEALVPREYLMVDLPKLKAAVKAGVRVVPGCNIAEDEALTRRPGR